MNEKREEGMEFDGKRQRGGRMERKKRKGRDGREEMEVKKMI